MNIIELYMYIEHGLWIMICCLGCLRTAVVVVVTYAHAPTHMLFTYLAW